MKYASELPARSAGRVVSFGVDQAKRPFARYSLRNSRTVGKVVRTRRYVADKTPQKVYDLNTKQRKLSARYFRDADLGGRSPSELEAAGKLMAENNPKQVSRMLRRMDDSGQQAFLGPDMDPAVRRNLYDGWKADRLVSAEDAAASARKYKDVDANGRRVLDDVLTDPDARSAWIRTLGDDAVQADDAVASARKYGDLDSTKRSQFRELLADDDLRDSWVSVTADREITTADIEITIGRVETNSQHSVSNFKIGRNANPEDAAYPPHDPDSIVVEMKLEEGDEFWRVYERKSQTSNPDENLAGGFVARRSTLQSAETPEQVLDRLALLRSEWQEYNYVGKVELTDEFVENNQIRVQVSTTRRQASDVSDEVRPGGGTQYLLQDDLQPTDQGVNWEPVDDLGDFVD